MNAIYREEYLNTVSESTRTFLTEVEEGQNSLAEYIEWVWRDGCVVKKDEGGNKVLRPFVEYEGYEKMFKYSEEVFTVEMLDYLEWLCSRFTPEERFELVAKPDIPFSICGIDFWAKTKNRVKDKRNGPFDLDIFPQGKGFKGATYLLCPTWELVKEAVLFLAKQQ